MKIVDVKYAKGKFFLYYWGRVITLTEDEARKLALEILNNLADKGDDWIGDALNCIPKEYF